MNKNPYSSAFQHISVMFIVPNSERCCMSRGQNMKANFHEKQEKYECCILDT